MKSLGIIGIVIGGIGLLSSLTVMNDPALFAVDIAIYGFFLAMSIMVVKTTK